MLGLGLEDDFLVGPAGHAVLFLDAAADDLGGVAAGACALGGALEIGEAEVDPAVLVELGVEGDVHHAALPDLAGGGRVLHGVGERAGFARSAGREDAQSPAALGDE